MFDRPTRYRTETVLTDHVPAPAGAGDPQDAFKEEQPTLLEGAPLAVKRRVEHGASPLSCCKPQPHKINNNKTTSTTTRHSCALLLVTVSAVRNTAGGHVQTFQGSVTREKTHNEQCTSHSSQNSTVHACASPLDHMMPTVSRLRAANSAHASSTHAR